MRYPNLYLVGAPKSGTSSVYGWLERVPAVFTAGIKELDHFGADLRYGKRRSPADYEAAYQGWDAEPWALDASVFLLLSRTAAEEIHAVRPDARILVLLREPVDAVASLHRQLLASGDEHEEDLGAALALAPARTRGEAIPPLARHPHALQYLDVVHYAPQVARYLDRFGPEQVHVELFDDLAAAPDEVLGRILAWLDVTVPEGVVIPVDEVANPATAVRSRWLRDVVRRPPAPLRRIGRAVLRSSGARRAVRRRVRRAAHRVNRVEVPRAAPQGAVRRQLVEATGPWVDELEAVLGRDLGRWRQV